MIGNYVWLDTNRDNLQDNGEPGVQNVTVSITDVNGGPVTDIYGNPVTATTTDANGYYEFINLSPGYYEILFDITTLPADTAIVESNTNSNGNDSEDSDPNADGKVFVDVSDGVDDLTIDM